MTFEVSTEIKADSVNIVMVYDKDEPQLRQMASGGETLKIGAYDIHENYHNYTFNITGIDEALADLWCI